MLSSMLNQLEGKGLLQYTRRTLCAPFAELVDSVLMGQDRKMSDGMFLSACREISKEFPDVAYDEDLLDRVCLRVNSIFCTVSPTNEFVR